MSWYRSYLGETGRPSLYDGGGEIAYDVGSPPLKALAPPMTASGLRSSPSPGPKKGSAAAREATACPLRQAQPRMCSPVPAPATPQAPKVPSEIEPLVPASAEVQAVAPAGAAGAAPASIQVELQAQRSAGPGSARQGAAPLFPDPLLHWVDCWAGPGPTKRAAPRRTGKCKQPRTQDQEPPDDKELRVPLLPPPPQPPSEPPAAQPPHLQLQLQLPQQQQPQPPRSAPGPACKQDVPPRPGRPLQHSQSDASLSSSFSCSDIPCSPRQGMQQRRQQQQQLCVQLQPAGRSRSQPAPPAPAPTTAAPVAAAAAAGPAPGAAPAAAPHVQAPPRQSTMPLRWWLLGGVALAGVSAGAVAASYAVLAYVMKVSLMSSLAWKAATGVAAAEGLALGGWSCSSVRAGKASAAQSAAELAWFRSKAEKEIAALRALLKQKQAEHAHEVTGLSALNDKLSCLAGQSLETVAALQASQAGSAALLETSGAHQAVMLQEVAHLSRGQAQLLAFVCEMREDVMGLVEQQYGADLAAAAAAGAAAVSAGSVTGWQPSGRSFISSTAGKDLMDGDDDLARCRNEPIPVGPRQLSSGSSTGSEDSEADNTCRERDLMPVPSPAAAGAAAALAAALGEDGQLQLRRLSSVKGKVTAALAATVSQTLQL